MSDLIRLETSLKKGVLLGSFKTDVCASTGAYFTARLAHTRIYLAYIKVRKLRDLRNCIGIRVGCNRGRQFARLLKQLADGLLYLVHKA